MDNDWKKRLGVVYSTNPDFQYGEDAEDRQESISPGQQKLYVSLDRKNRKGKAVTLVEGFKGSDEELKSLGKELKSKCGSGGSVKDGEMIIQGDFRDRVITLLRDKGFVVKQKGG
ncbi:MAG: translation initiation factor [Bacteroidales bacterium]